ncbi:hypothetical protein D3C87_333510 [compost metagenome]
MAKNVGNQQKGRMKMEHPTFLTKLLLTWIPIGQQPQADGLFFYNLYPLLIDQF